MIQDNVPAAEADQMVVEGARILEHKTVDGERFCTVEVPSAQGGSTEVFTGGEAPKKRGKPRKTNH